jgi:type VI secretion system protein ImpE
MTPHDALAEGRLKDAIAIQEAAVVAEPSDPAKRRLLIDLLAFAGQFDAALEHLAKIESTEPEWHEIERNFHLLCHSERFRSVEDHKPLFHPETLSKHATQRWLAINAIRQAQPEEAVQHIDAADDTTPEVWGFLDGQEFEGLRDADDRFASILEAFRGGEYHWFAWEAIRKVELAPASVLLDQLYRPATVTMKDNGNFSVHLPLVYPGSYQFDDSFALGTETDHICPDGGPTRCIGGKLLLVGDSAEVPLSECRMIEIR